ncbi:MAG: 3-hydroxy-3-methylglutaryl-CoA reductase [bacterium]|nr:3-hydroxy-3-methylglutaryl-CoA reductase [bacterium]
MDLRNLPTTLSSHERCAVRRMKIQDTLDLNLSLLGTEPNRIGQAEEKNCEQMFGSIPIPVGYAGPLKVTFSSQETREIHLPLATTEGALVASVNRGCKAVTDAQRGDASPHAGIKITSIYHGITRSIAFRVKEKPEQLIDSINQKEKEWKAIGEATSSHLKILGYDIDQADNYVFLSLRADTQEAMGMNMITIAAQQIGDWITQKCDTELITIAGNIDSDKKPSRRTHDQGRGYEVIAEALLKPHIIQEILKVDPVKMLDVYEAKLKRGSAIAGAIGSNLHAANTIAALYLATGQDAAHTVEGSMTDTTVTQEAHGISVRVRCPALLVGVRGGGTELPAQRQCLNMLLNTNQRTNEPTSLRPAQQLAESIGAAVLAGEISLLAAQAAQKLASSHKKLAR